MWFLGILKRWPMMFLKTSTVIFNTVCISISCCYYFWMLKFSYLWPAGTSWIFCFLLCFLIQVTCPRLSCRFLAPVLESALGLPEEPRWLFMVNYIQSYDLENRSVHWVGHYSWPLQWTDFFLRAKINASWVHTNISKFRIAVFLLIWFHICISFFWYW